MEYMSQEGYDELVAELQHMVNVELPAVRDAIAEARDKGDLSENFEYHAAKREQGKLLSRISFKQKVLENARVIDKSRLKSDTVGLLSKIKITNLANKCSMNYTIVNPHEADLHSGKISIKSPIAKALLGKKAGEEVMVRYQPACSNSAWIAWSYNVFFKRKTPDNLKLIKLSGVSLFILIFFQNLIQ